MTAVGESTDLIRRLEAAADVVMSPPNKVKPDERKTAESFFIELRNSTKVPLHLCRMVLEHTSNAFVIFQCVSAVREATLREWAVLDADSVEAVYKYLLDFGVNNQTLPSYVQAELFQAIAMILKRATFDKKTGGSEYFYSAIENLIASGDSSSQALACQALLSLCNEYTCSWRSSDVGITWDFHIRAKRHFEATDLKRIFQDTLRVLNAIVSSDTAANGRVEDRQQLVLCNRFICVAETILSWHFGMKLLPKRLTYELEFTPSSALRPPASWKDVFLNPDYINFFFVLHTRIRHNAELSHHSMQCLIQLCSLSGEVFNTTGAPPGTSSEPKRAYVETIIRNITQLFAAGAQDHEVLDVATMVSKTFGYNPLPYLLRMPKGQFDAFLSFLVQFIQSLCPKAVHDIVTDSDTQHNYEALVLLLDNWYVLLKAEGRLPQLPTGTLRAATTQLYDSFMQAIVAPPRGTRPNTQSDQSNGCADEGVDGDDAVDLTQEDREQYADLLRTVGDMTKGCYEHAVYVCTELLTEKLMQLSDMLAQTATAGTTQIQPDTLLTWQEDMHWILLLTGKTLTIDEVLGDFVSSHFRPDAITLSVETTDVSLAHSRAYLHASVSDPSAAMSMPDGGVCRVIKLISRVFLWSAIEYRLLCDNRVTLLSPQLAQTTFWVLRAIVMAYCLVPEELELTSILPRAGTTTDTTEDQDSSRGRTPPPMEPVVVHCIAAGSEQAQFVIDYVLQRCFSSLTQWSGERRVASDAVLLLISLMDCSTRAEQVGRSPALLPCISRIDMQRIHSSTRRQLMRALVQIGACSDDQQLQQTLFDQCLSPLATRFHQLVCQTDATVSTNETHIVDCVDCFTGVAAAMQLYAANVLYGWCDYLIPLLELCPPLLSRYANSQPLVDGVLSLFVEITKRLAVLMDSEQTDCQRLYACLMHLLKVYAHNQLVKYSANTQVDEDKASDLQLMMTVLSNILSRDLLVSISQFREDTDTQVMSAGCVALCGLEMIMPLMTAELLQFPTLCKKFYSLLLYMAEMYPDKLLAMRPDVIAAFLQCAQLGLQSSYGKEVLSTSLELIGVLATYLCQNADPNCEQLKKDMGVFIKPVFVSALETSCEVSIFQEAVHALYALICCNLSSYNTMVLEIVQAHDSSTPAAAAVPERASKLQSAFAQLLPNTDVQIVNCTRVDKRAFRERFDVFLNDISGLLCLQLMQLHQQT